MALSNPKPLTEKKGGTGLWAGRFLWLLLGVCVGGFAVRIYDTHPFFTKKSLGPSVSSLSFVQKNNGLYCQKPDALPRVPVLRVMDGDTAEILWKNQPTFLRYYGVNTPERGHPCYDGATARNRALSGPVLRLAFDDRDRDRYGRLLAYVFTEDGRSVDAQLTAEGWGRAWRRDGRLRGNIVPLEDQAKAEKIGCLWNGEVPLEEKPHRPRKKKKKS